MYAYRFAGYWRDVGTIDSLWEANMEVLDPENSGIDIFDEKWKIDVYKRQVWACAALDAVLAALAAARCAAVEALLELSSTRATNCSYCEGGSSSAPPSMGRMA